MQFHGASFYSTAGILSSLNTEVVWNKTPGKAGVVVCFLKKKRNKQPPSKSRFHYEGFFIIKLSNSDKNSRERLFYQIKQPDQKKVLLKKWRGNAIDNHCICYRSKESIPSVFPAGNLFVPEERIGTNILLEWASTGTP